MTHIDEDGPEGRLWYRRLWYFISLQMLPWEYRVVEWLLLLALILNRLHEAYH